MRQTIYWSFALLLMSGCVSLVKHEQLQKKYDFARAELQASHERVRTSEEREQTRERELEGMSEALDLTRAQAARLELGHADDVALLAAQSDENERLNKQLAEVLKDRSRLKQSTDQLSQALLQVAARKAKAEQRVAEYRALLDRFRNLIDAGTLTVHVREGRMVLALPTDVLFDSGSARLSQPGKAALVQVATVLAATPTRRIQVEGHTDNVPIHTATFASNWELAAARALSVLRTLTGSGLGNETVSAASFGEFHPAGSNDTPAGRASNRRIEIVLLPDLSSLPGFDELRAAIASS